MRYRSATMLFVRPFLILGALFAVLAALSSCAALGVGLREPGVEIVDVQVSRAGLTGADLVFELEVDNPNRVALVLDRVDYRLRFNGEPLLNGRRDRRTEVAPRSLSRVELPVRLRYEDIIRAVESLDDNDRPTYELRADLLFDVPVVGSMNVPVTRRGEIPLRRFLGSILGR